MLIETAAILLAMTQSANSRTSANADPNQVICRAPEAVLGSRVARRRVCKTRAEWRAHEADREQARRDMQTSGMGEPKN